MMLLLRILAIPALWSLVRWQRSHRSSVLNDIEQLNPDRKLSLAWRLARDRRVPLLARPLAVLPAMYGASPIDLLPDFLPLVGRLDDAFIFSVAFGLLSLAVPAEILEEHLGVIRN
jgi:uncharacterized membrane protein YkvA (DUF1232 family)